MNYNIHIIVLGTSHPLQCGSKECTKEQIQNFRQCLKQIIEDYKIKCIVEEMSDEGLKNHEVENTVAYELSKDLIDIKHKYTDLSSEHIADLCIDIDQFMLREATNYMKENKRELLHRHLLNPIRQRFWLANMLYLNTWPTLFICGSEHVNKMADLINVLEYGPVHSFLSC